MIFLSVAGMVFCCEERLQSQFCLLQRELSVVAGLTSNFFFFPAVSEKMTLVLEIYEQCYVFFF